MTLKPTLACNHMHSKRRMRMREKDRAVKKCEFFAKARKAVASFSMLLTATRAVCIIYFAAHTALRILSLSIRLTD